MAQLVRANRCTTMLLQRATLISLPDGSGGRREITNPHPVTLSIKCPELLKKTARFQLNLQKKQNEKQRLKTSHTLWFPLIIFLSLGVFTRR